MHVIWGQQAQVMRPPIVHAVPAALASQGPAAGGKSSGRNVLGPTMIPLLMLVPGLEPR